MAEKIGEEQRDDGRRQVNVENESFDVALGVRDQHGHFIPLTLTPGSAAFALDMVLKLVDAAANEVQARADANRILWTRPYEEYEFVAAALLPTAGSSLLYDPATTVNELYLVEYNVCNVDPNIPALARWYDIGIDQASGGALAAAEYIAYQEPVPPGGGTGWRGPFLMRGNDQLRGRAQTLTTLTLQLRVRRIDTGA
jgi:hypothetical protein